jgi:hypothetical protein
MVQENGFGILSRDRRRPAGTRRAARAAQLVPPRGRRSQGSKRQFGPELLDALAHFNASAQHAPDLRDTRFRRLRQRIMTSLRGHQRCQARKAGTQTSGSRIWPRAQASISARFTRTGSAAPMARKRRKAKRIRKPSGLTGSRNHIISGYEQRDDGLEFLLAFDGLIHHLEDGYWLKFEIRRVGTVKERPHGLSYSFKLHAPNGTRLIGFDNAHGVSGAGSRFRQRPVANDHWHRTESDIGRPYAFTDADTLLHDFFREVHRVLAGRGIPEAIAGTEDTSTVKR